MLEVDGQTYAIGYSAGAALYVSGTPASKMDAPNKNPANRAGAQSDPEKTPTI
jgi:hypothetical protein